VLLEKLQLPKPVLVVQWFMHNATAVVERLAPTRAAVDNGHPNAKSLYIARA
jgi:hypothetical protein